MGTIPRAAAFAARLGPSEGRLRVPCTPMTAAGRKSIPLHTKILIGLIAGAGAGGTLNAVVGDDSPPLL